MRAAGGLVWEAYENWRADRAIRLGASLAYYALFAIVPVASLSIATAGLLFSQADIEAYLADRLEASPFGDLSGTVDELAGAIDATSTVGGLAILGLLSGLLAASVVFIALQDTFNIIWGIPIERGFRSKLRRRLLAFSIVLLAGALLTASLMVQSALVVLERLVPGEVMSVAVVQDALAAATSGVLAVVALVVLFQLLVQERLDWRSLVITSTVTVVLLVAGTWALGWYFRTLGSASVTGAAGSVLVVLAWLYYEAQIFIGGAELLKVLDRRAASA